MDRERIMVIPADKLKHYLKSDNIKNCRLITGKRAIQLYHDICGWAIDIDRTEELEKAPYYRQIIPCCTVAKFPQKVGRKREEHLILMTRGKKQSEKRLHSLNYVEVGGHLRAGETVLEGMKRELKEELGLTVHTPELFFQGIIVDYTDEVGLCHIGILYHMYVEDWRLQDFRYLPEYELHKHRWCSFNAIERQQHKLGSWAKCIIRNYYA